MSIEEESRSAATKLLDFLAAEFDADGVSITGPDNAQFYYKLPGVMCYAGRREVAYRTLDQFASRFMKPGVLDLSADPVALPWTPYIGGWAATGAAMLGRFDLARGMMKTVQALRDRGTGGYKFEGADGTSTLDIELTGAALMGSVWTDGFVGAGAAARFLRDLLDKQPSPDDEFFLRMNLEGDVIEDRIDPTGHYGMEDPFASPAAFGTGISGLVWLARCTGDPELLDLANAYIDAALKHRQNPASLILATKFGWSVQMVSVHRDRERLSELSKRCAEDLIERQSPDGSIDFSGLPASLQPGSQQWLVVLGCDSALSLMAVANQSA